MVRFNHKDTSSSDQSDHGHQGWRQNGRTDRVRFGCSCGIRSANEYQDMIAKRAKKTTKASTKLKETSMAWAEAQAIDHNNGHFSSEASARAVALCEGCHTAYKVTAGASAEFGIGGAVADAGADATIYNYSYDVGQVDVAKGYIARGLGIGAGGVKAKAEVGVDLVDVHVQFSKHQGVDANIGLNADTGAEIGVDGVSASFLGLGFSLGRKTGISTPICGINFRLW